MLLVRRDRRWCRHSTTNWPCTTCGVPSGRISARMLADSGRSASTVAFVEPQRQQNVAGGNLARLDADRADAVGERAHRRAQHPGPLGILGLEPEDHAALGRPRQAHVDLVESPVLAVAPVVDDQIAVLEAELAQIVAVEAAGADAVDPGQDAGDILEIRTQRTRRSACVGRLAWDARASAAARRVAIGRLSAPANTVTRPSVSMRTAISAPTRLRLSRAHAAHQQARAGKADFGFRCARDHGAVGVAHDDVAQAQRRAALLVALDLGAADHDRMLAAEILLDRRLQPRRRDIEFDRSARQAPPQTERHDGDDCGQRMPCSRTGTDGGPAEKRLNPRRKLPHRRPPAACAAGRCGAWPMASV